MTKKQKRNLAKKIAEIEKLIQSETDPAKVQSAKEQMIKLTNSVEMDLSEINEVDEMVREILERET